MSCAETCFTAPTVGALTGSLAVTGFTGSTYGPNAAKGMMRMSGIKYYELDENEELPYEFVVTRHVDGEPEFAGSYISTRCLSYENGVLLKFHERNDELRAETVKLRKLVRDWRDLAVGGADSLTDWNHAQADLEQRMRELGVDV